MPPIFTSSSARSISAVLLTVVLCQFCAVRVRGQSNGDLRLNYNGSTVNRSSGRLEVYYVGFWATVCARNDSFGASNAIVACRQLGFYTYSRYGSVGSLGFSEGPSSHLISLDNLFCAGLESRLQDCPHRITRNCSHSEDVGLICTSSNTSQSDGDLRLNYNGSTVNHSSGRLEVYYSGHWGTVCDRYFDVKDAIVACQQLGFSSYSRYGSVGSLGFSQGSQSVIWFDSLRCTGTESTLASCPHSRRGNQICGHHEDVGLICTSSNTSQSDGDLRLNYYGSIVNSSSGRLEVYFSGHWGTVCDNSFSAIDAVVACQQLGFTDHSRYGIVSSLGFSEGSSSQVTWLDNLGCSGSESRLEDCPHRGYGAAICGHSLDVGLVCTSLNTSQSDGDLRLNYNGSIVNSSSGRLEVYFSGHWGTVCDNLFGAIDATVACQQLGFSGFSRYGSVGSLGFSQGSQAIWLNYLHCIGTESRLASCPHSNSHANENCGHHEDVGLICSSSNTSQSDGDLRLNYNGSTVNSSSGRLEVYYRGHWGTVCNGLFDTIVAIVACRQLGFDTYSRYGSVGSLGFSQDSSSQAIWLNAFNCNGTENRLVSCRHSGYGRGDEDCGHHEDIGLVCTTFNRGKSDGELRLNYYGSTDNRSSGTLEVYFSGQWGTVCARGFDAKDAIVACRQLGFTSYSRYSTVRDLGLGQGSSSQTIWLDDLGCSGSESRLVNCSHRSFGAGICDHSQDVGLVCSNYDTTTDASGLVTGDLRLVSRNGSTGLSSGRLEVYYNREWGTVCDDMFAGIDANVACRQLGYSRAYCYGRVESLGYTQARPSTPTWLDDLRCTFSDYSLLNCDHNGVGVEDCSHYEDIALVCTYRSTCSGYTSDGGSSGGGGVSVYTIIGGVVSAVGFLLICCCACCTCCLSSKHRPGNAQANTACSQDSTVCPATVIASSRATNKYTFNSEMTTHSVVAAGETNKQANTTLQQQDSPPVYPGTDTTKVPYPSQNINTLPPVYPAESAEGLHPGAPPPYPENGVRDNPA